MGTDLRGKLAAAEDRSDGLQRQVWGLGLELGRAEAERRVVLERAVDRRFAVGPEAEGVVEEAGLMTATAMVSAGGKLFP